MGRNDCRNVSVAPSADSAQSLGRLHAPSSPASAKKFKSAERVLGNCFSA
jgi:hypothetical protein